MKPSKNINLALNCSSNVVIADCDECNNTFCWSDVQHQQYLYYTQVFNINHRYVYLHPPFDKVSYFEMAIILINLTMVLVGIGGNAMVCRKGKEIFSITKTILGMHCCHSM